MASVTFNRMQNLNMNGGNCENKFYHYCYVCNTQLNSCKQALLHCSGKRHRKKLQFLQSRKSGQFGGAQDTDQNAFQFPPPPPPPAASLPPPPATHIGALATVPTPTFVSPNGPVAPALVTALPTASTSPSHVPPAANPTSAGCFYPIMTPVEHWLAPVPPTFVHFHGGQFAAIPNTAVFRQQNHGSHLHPSGALHPPRALKPVFMANECGPHMQPRPLLRYHESFASTGSSSPVVLTDVSAFGSGSSTGTRSAVISPSETSSISSESLISPKARLLYRCQVCQRQFVTNSQLQVHLQATRHYKQYLLQGSNMERTGDSSEAESWVSSSSIYYCMFCNIAVNSPAKLEAHIASHRFKRITVPTVRTHSRSSSTSSETRGEIIMDSGYVSGSSDELICISHPTPEKPTPKFRCQICSIFLNSPAQAKQHLSSQKHLQRLSSLRPSFRRKSSSSFKRKQSLDQQQSQKSQSPQQSVDCAVESDANSNQAQGEPSPSATRPLETPSPEDDLAIVANENEDEDDDATLIRCHSL